MLPKKQTPLVRAETICCTLAAVIVAICLAHHPGTSWPLAVTLALLIAAMSAEGVSTIQNIDQIDRGYCNIDGRLNALGARITRCEECG